MSSLPFSPIGPTVTIVANATAPAAVQALTGSLGGGQFLITNPTANLVMLGVGQTASQAAANAANVYILPVLPNSAAVFTFAQNAYFTAIASAGASSIYVTPGDGI